ncbi:TolA protein [Draconibacterium orientale]|uniref:TolA protein n=2 Tax=Draconibacterium orientale TaxID=1168034 RepID=A0A1I0GFQ2_9BACT|nr:cell envelope integrity protein TolA [Draconibacterium orientale]SET69917.1 TolA protein [Draconibacterium orientale]
MIEREEYSEKKKGLIGTIVFHTIVLILLLVLGFFTPLPLPGEEGILVNFGNSENGLGDREPSPARRQQQTTPPPPPQTAQKKSTPPTAQQTPPPPVKTSEPEPAKEVAMTQDYEKTVAIEAAEKKKKEEERKRQQELDEKKRKEQEEIDRKNAEEAEQKRLAEIERKKQEEIERQQREEAERIAREEAERKAREEAERQRKLEEQRKIAEINSRTQGAFANSGSGSGGTGNSDGKSQGATFPGGNQGVPTGDPNATNYGDGGSGAGNQGTGAGISFDLGGRSAISLPKPEYPGNDAGIVVVKVIVDKNGRVTSAEPGVRGTTIANKAFWDEAKQAALKAKFNVDPDAAAFQQGTISYRFRLD